MLKKQTLVVLFGLVIMGSLVYRLYSSSGKSEEAPVLLPGKAPPLLDNLSYTRLETATFAMGCFWGADGLFGSTPGVIRTRVGYTGGTAENPTYNTIQDHTEAVQIDYDPEQISFHELLEIFWANHNPYYLPWSQQYKSAVFTHSEEQRQLAYEVKSLKELQTNKTLYTDIEPLTVFYLAEGYHQKYRLQQEKELFNEFKAMYPNMNDLVASTATSRVNGYLSGYGDPDTLKEDLNSLGLSKTGRERLVELFNERNKNKLCINFP